MNAVDLREADPLVFVMGVLDLLPDPAEASVRDLQVLASTGIGLHKIVVQIGSEIAALDYRVRAGTRVADVAGEVVQLEALQRRGEMARRRLADYADRASTAIGLTTVAGPAD
jgi:hypothetical protein